MSDEKTPDKAGTESADAGKDKGSEKLNDLLASWDDDGKSETKASKTTDDAVLNEIADLRLQMDLPKYIDAVKGETGLSDKFCTGLISEAIRTDDKFAKLWDNRHSNKDAWNEALKSLNEEAVAEVKRIKGDTEKVADNKDDDGLAAAVRSAREGGNSGDGFDGKNPADMSDADFHLHKAEVFRLARAGQLK